MVHEAVRDVVWERLGNNIVGTQVKSVSTRILNRRAAEQASFRLIKRASQSLAHVGWARPHLDFPTQIATFPYPDRDKGAIVMLSVSSFYVTLRGGLS